MDQSESTGEKQLRIRRGRVDSLTLYEITDYELDVLIQGSPDSIYLNLSIFFLSVAVSFFVSLITATVSTKVFTIFVVVIATFAIAGAVLFILWINYRKSRSALVNKIKNRMPPDGESVTESS